MSLLTEDASFFFVFSVCRLLCNRVAWCASFTDSAAVFLKAAAYPPIEVSSGGLLEDEVLVVAVDDESEFAEPFLPSS